MRFTLLSLLLALALIIGPGATSTSTGTEFAPTARALKIQRIVDVMKEKLSMPQDVSVAIVPRNTLLVSVETLPDRPDAFLMAVDDHFLDALEDDDLAAVVAHELGHVWIFTHHPYLQTEQLANKIAMRIVTRASLEKVYAKVWAHGGAKGDLARFLGD